MTRLVRWAARLYPSAWRARYGAEFEALLEDAGSGWRDVGDVFKGAIQMHLTGWSFRSFTAAGAALGLIAAALIAFQTQDRYVSTAVLGMGAGMGTDPGAALFHVQRQVLNRNSLGEIIQKYGLYPRERARMPLEDVIQEMMNRNIQILAINQAGTPRIGAFQLRFSDTDRTKAQAVTRELTDRFIHAAPPSIVMASQPPVVSLQVLDPPSLPQGPFYPNRLSFILAGLAIGAAVGAIAASARRWPVIIGAGIAGAVLAGALSFALPSRWTANAVVMVRPPEAAAQVVDGARGMASGKDVRVITTPRQGTLLVQSSDRNPALAQSAVEQFLKNMIPPSGNHVVEVEVLDPARYGHPVSPNRALIALAGLAVGLLLGSMVHRFRPRRALADAG